MNWLDCLNQSLAYIEAHLEEEIDYEEIAKVACASSYHYQRMFSAITNVPLGEYIRRRRLSLAAIRLQESNEKVIDIALRYGYQSPTAFNRAFMNMHGIPPTKARQKGVKLKLFPPISFQISVKGEVAMNYRIEEKEGFRLVGVKEAITTANGENFIKVPKVWERLWNEGVYEEITALANGSPRGVMGVCTNFRQGEFDYYVAVSSDRVVPDNMEAIEVRAGTWVAFECKGVQGIQDTFKRLYSEWFPTSGYEHSGGPEIEWYPGEDTDTEAFACEVWIPIIKK